METANLQLTDYDVIGRPSSIDMAMSSSPLSSVLSDELTGAAEALGVGVDVILLAALGRAVQRTIDTGPMSVDVPSYGTSVQSLSVPCVPPLHTSATDLLIGVHQALGALALQRIVHGVLDDPRTQPLSDVLFAHGDTATARPHLGHVLELRATDGPDGVELAWFYDSRSFAPYTVEELAEQFPLALIELTSDAASPLITATELAMAH